MDNYDASKYEIAIIGMAGRFPKAKNLEAFWQNLIEGKECVTFFTEEELLAAGVTAANLEQETYVKARPYLEEVEYFDANFFKINSREASLMDPQHRLFLECVWEAMEDAGYVPHKYQGDIGVFAACDTNTYLLQNVLLNDPSIIQNDPLQIKMNDKDYLCTRVSYMLNLTGPSVMVQSACSSSLAAIHYAMESILGGECDMALAGAVSLTLPNKTGYFYKTGGVVSVDGHCKSFDKGSSGTVYGDGVGAVVLKRLSEAIRDKDNIYGVIKGMAVNNDGGSRIGFTAPSLTGQTKVVKEAMDMADVGCDQISYIETHGTGTRLGDSIEIAALTEAYSDRPLSNKCPIGSIKPNIGHSSTASGIASLIKVALSLKHEMIPPTIHYTSANTDIDFDQSPFYVTTQLKDWKRSSQPRIAGISAFGLGGSNAHLIIEEPPRREETVSDEHCQAIFLSAKTENALLNYEKDLLNYLKHNKSIHLRDIAGTLYRGRAFFSHRSTLVARNVEELCTSLERKDENYETGQCVDVEKETVVFMFPGVGEEYPGIAKELCEEIPLYRQYLQACDAIIQEKYHWQLMDHLLVDPILDTKEDTKSYMKKMLDADANRGFNFEMKYTYVTVFALEYAMAKLLMSSGVMPDKFIGYSIGEYVAAHLAGVFSLEDTIDLLYQRGALIDQLSEGRMLSIMLSEEEVKPYLSDKVSLAAVETPKICVVAGECQAIEALEVTLKEKVVACRRIPTRYAFHSQMMTPILKAYKEIIQKVDKNAPWLPFISNITGKPITKEEAVSNDYWCQHLISTVKFSQGMLSLLDEEAIFIEAGAGNGLSSFALQHSRELKGKVIQTMGTHYKGQEGVKRLLTALGKLWNRGYQVKWDTLVQYEPFNKIALPHYPFERKKYWLEPNISHLAQLITGVSNRSVTEKAKVTQEILVREDLKSDYLPITTPTQEDVLRLWERTLGIQGIGSQDDFFEIGGNSLLAVNIMYEVRKEHHVDIALELFYKEPTIQFIAAYIDMYKWHHKDENRTKEENHEEWQEMIL